MFIYLLAAAAAVVCCCCCCVCVFRQVQVTTHMEVTGQQSRVNSLQDLGIELSFPRPCVHRHLYPLKHIVGP